MAKAMKSQPNLILVSCFLPIGRKRETDGNQTGNGEETKGSSLCRIGNGANHTDGNKGAFFDDFRFHRSFERDIPAQGRNSPDFRHTSPAHARA